MKKLILLAVFFHGVLSYASILKLPHQSFTLKNGLKVYLVKYPSPGVVAYQLAVHVGSGDEIDKGRSGFAHFFEHLMFRGTKKRDGEALRKLYVRLGADNNAWTGQDMTDYHGIVSSKYLSQILEAEADRFQNLTFSEKAMRDEAGAVLGEYNKYAANPMFILEEKLWGTAFQVHPYTHETIGYLTDIQNYPERYKDVWPFFKRFYRPENASLILVGDIQIPAAMKAVEAYFGKWKGSEIPEVKGEKPFVVPQEPEQTEARSAEVRVEKEVQTRAMIAYKFPAFSSRRVDSAAIRILSEIYFSKFSDFQKEYVFKKRWLDSVDPAPVDNKYPGIWTVLLRFTKEGEGKEKDVIAAVEKVLSKIRSDGPSPERVKQTQTRFRNQALTQWFEGPGELAEVIARYTGFENDLEVIDRVLDRMQEVRGEDLKMIAKKYLTESRKTVVILSGGKK